MLSRGGGVRTEEERQDIFGGIATRQEVVAAYEGGDSAKRELAESLIRVVYAPVVDVHWVTVKQLAVLEPTLVETIACMVGALLTDATTRT